MSMPIVSPNGYNNADCPKNVILLSGSCQAARHHAAIEGQWIHVRKADAASELRSFCQAWVPQNKPCFPSEAGC